MSRRANIVIVCEDEQHEAFIRRFLERDGFEKRRFRVERKSMPGSAEQWVRKRYPTEVKAYRDSHSTDRGLVVMIDDDLSGCRREQLAKALDDASAAPRGDDGRIAVIVPTRNIETWLAYLGGAKVDESTVYPKLMRARECQPHVNALHAMCQRQELRAHPPASLGQACEEYRTRIRPLRGGQ